MDESEMQPGSAGETTATTQVNEAAALSPGGENTLGPAEKAPARKRNLRLIGGLGLLVVVLAAAAFVGGRLLNRGPAGAVNGLSSGQPRVMISKGGNSTTFTIAPAKELPQTKPDLMGVLVRRQDNSLFLGTGKVTRLVQKSGSQSQPQASAPTYDGPVLEAVITHDTQIFRDETNFTAPPDASGKIQQVIKPGSLDDITPNSMIQVWGDKTGERTIVRILVYQPG